LITQPPADLPLVQVTHGNPVQGEGDVAPGEGEDSWTKQSQLPERTADADEPRLYRVISIEPLAFVGPRDLIVMAPPDDRQFASGLPPAGPRITLVSGWFPVDT
jgi:hypothetical protein